MPTRYTPRCQVADLADDQDLLTRLRRHVHRYPELSFGPVTGSEDFDDASLRVGAACWTRLVETYLPAAA